MARIWQSGFELNSTTSLVEWSATSGSPTISTTTVRTGTYAGRISSLSSGTPQFFAINAVTSGTATYFHRAYFRYHTLPSAENTVILINNSDTDNGFGTYITLGSDGKLRLYDGSGVVVGSASSALTADTWYRVELKYLFSNTSGGICELKIDGTTIATKTTDNNLSYGGFFVGGNLNSEAQTTGDWFFDDIAINDDSGSNQTTYPGAGQITHLVPDSVGDNSQWTPLSGANWTNVDEVPPDDATSYNANGPINNIDDYGLAATPSSIASGDTINTVLVGVRFTRTSTGANPSVQTRIKKTSAGTVTSSTAFNWNTGANTWRTNSATAPYPYKLVTYTDPDGAAWTKTTLDSMQIGVKQTNGTGATAPRLTSIWASIDSTPVISSVTVNVFDSITVSESTTAAIIGGVTNLNVSVSDNVTVAESTTASLSNKVSIVDNATISDGGGAGPGPVVQEVNNISVVDNSAVSESTIASESYKVSVVDNNTVSESTISSEVYQPQISDNITVSETITPLIPILFINQFDNVTVSEAITPQEVNRVSVVDNITVSEFINAGIPITLSVFDTATVSETTIPSLVNNVSVFDNNTVSETIVPLIPSLKISIVDNTTVSENIVASIPAIGSLNINVFDLATIAESVVPQKVNTINVFDQILVSESILESESKNISVFDPITVSEDIFHYDGDSVVISELITIQINGPTPPPTTHLNNRRFMMYRARSRRMR